MARSEGAGYRRSVSAGQDESEQPFGTEAGSGLTPSGRELVEASLDLVDMILNQLVRDEGLAGDREELRAFGRQGLVEAAGRFDPGRGFEFRHYAYDRIRGAMVDGLRKSGVWSRRAYEHARLIRAIQPIREQTFEEATPPDRVPAQVQHEKMSDFLARMATAMATGTLVEAAFDEGEVVAKARGRSAEEMLGDLEQNEFIRRAVADLPKDEGEIIRRYYVDGHALDDVARDWGCSRSWVSRVHGRAVRRLGLRLRSLK